MRFGLALRSFSSPDLDYAKAARLRGTPDRIRRRIAELQAAGLEYLMLSPLDHDLEQLDLWEAEVLRHFRAG